jgi:hypothetical protein
MTAETRGDGGRIGWRVAGTVVAVLMLGIGTANAVGALAHDTWRVHRVIATPVTVVDVATSGGSITAVGTAGSAETEGVVVDMTVSRGLETPSHSEDVVGDRAVLRSHCVPFVGYTFCQVDYVIHVPDGVAVVAHSDGGDVAVSDVHGDVDISSSGGDLSARDVEAQRAVFGTDGGDVTTNGLSATTIEARSSGGDVGLVLGSSPTTVRASSDGGDVEIVLPDTRDAYRVNISSDGGSTEAAVRTDPASDPRRRGELERRRRDRSIPDGLSHEVRRPRWSATRSHRGIRST